MVDAWKLLNPLVVGRDVGCDGEVGGPDDAYFDFSDSENWTADEAASFERLLSDANAAEVYRKALEPFVEEWLLRHDGDDASFTDLRVAPSRDEHALIREAARLMGLLPATDEVPPEPTASAKEAFEGKGAKE